MKKIYGYCFSLTILVIIKMSSRKNNINYILHYDLFSRYGIHPFPLLRCLYVAPHSHNDAVNITNIPHFLSPFFILRLAHRHRTVLHCPLNLTSVALIIVITHTACTRDVYEIQIIPRRTL